MELALNKHWDAVRGCHMLMTFGSSLGVHMRNVHDSYHYASFLPKATHDKTSTAGTGRHACSWRDWEVYHSITCLTPRSKFASAALRLPYLRLHVSVTRRPLLIPQNTHNGEVQPIPRQRYAYVTHVTSNCARASQTNGKTQALRLRPFSLSRLHQRAFSGRQCPSPSTSCDYRSSSAFRLYTLSF
jgi:hypothetical protein